MELLVYNLLFWIPYYWLCSIPEKLMQKAIEEGSKNVGNNRKNGKR